MKRMHQSSRSSLKICQVISHCWDKFCSLWQPWKLSNIFITLWKDVRELWSKMQKEDFTSVSSTCHFSYFLWHWFGRSFLDVCSVLYFYLFMSMCLGVLIFFLEMEREPFPFLQLKRFYYSTCMDCEFLVPDSSYHDMWFSSIGLVQYSWKSSWLLQSEDR